MVKKSTEEDCHTCQCIATDNNMTIFYHAQNATVARAYYYGRNIDSAVITTHVTNLIYFSIESL